MNRSLGSSITVEADEKWCQNYYMTIAFRHFKFLDFSSILSGPFSNTVLAIDTAAYKFVSTALAIMIVFIKAEQYLCEDQKYCKRHTQLLIHY